MKTLLRIPILLLLSFVVLLSSVAQSGKKALPVFENGEAQIVPAFENRDDWIRHDLWVETEFDTDGDQKPDRVHVAVTRPKQTDTEGLKLPVVYETSPFMPEQPASLMECSGMLNMNWGKCPKNAFTRRSNVGENAPSFPIPRSKPGFPGDISWFTLLLRVPACPRVHPP
jgi:hypothetical protein